MGARGERKKKFQITLPDATIEELEKLYQKRGHSKSVLIAIAIHELLQKDEKEKGASYFGR